MPPSIAAFRFAKVQLRIEPLHFLALRAVEGQGKLLEQVAGLLARLCCLVGLSGASKGRREEQQVGNLLRAGSRARTQFQLLSRLRDAVQPKMGPSGVR